MSTFRGIVREFPDIRIDFFREIRDQRPPLACFLSHVHSDHLAGLDKVSFNGSFIYCSAATREILLRLQTKTARMNFQQGILVKENVTYGHLTKLLKTIPLETPTRIELEPRNEIQVTLFDANHCTGAVMFLIEGNNKAILYTGDIRSEPWFVNNLTRNPFLIEYTNGLKTLDCIYLDTSNTIDIPFSPKADGLKELLQKVSKYPANTVFHFSAWTFGYEEVWMALSRTLKSQIHVDKYKLGIYESLRGTPDTKDPSGKYSSGPFLAHEGPALAGWKCGNTPQVGCLTSDPEARIHSCEKESGCPSLNNKTVWIRPIVARTEHGEIAEVGVGGGGGDLTGQPQLEVDSTYDIEEFLAMITGVDPILLEEIKQILSGGLRCHGTALSLHDMSLDQGELSLTKLADVLARFLAERKSATLSERLTDESLVHSGALPKVITFPYSRHSSYRELCHLVRVFDPKDIYPCTVDEAHWNEEEVSMERLFGYECSATKFRHDDEMRELQSERQLQYVNDQTQTTATSETSSQMAPSSGPVQRNPQTPKRGSVLLRRNSKGQLRGFDEGGNEIVPSDTAMAEAISTINRELTTPPFDIVAVSPGSASQELRRKAVMEGVNDKSAKRPRHSYDGPGSSPSKTSASSLRSTPRKNHNLPAALERSTESGGASTPGSQDGSDAGEQPACPPIANTSSVLQNPNRVETQPAEDPYAREFEDFNYDGDENTFIDHEDNIVRCKSCGCEVWTVWMTQRGFCTGGCGDGPNEVPYYEIADPEAGPRPGCEPGEYAQFHLDSLEPEHQNRKNIVGDYIDDHSDAYDTVDENSEYRSEYDSEDSFIDDASIHDPERERKDGSFASEEKVDYKQLFNDFQRKYYGLVRVHEDMMKNLVDLEYEYHESGSDVSNLSEVEEIDKCGAMVVDVSIPDPAVTEIVLSQAQDQSQESEISEGRLRDRAKAFKAVDVHGEGWHSISLVSTRDNHTHEEIEL